MTLKPPKELLLSPLINKSALAGLLFPNQKNPRQHLYTKMHERGGQRITEEDEKNIEKILSEYLLF